MTGRRQGRAPPNSDLYTLLMDYSSLCFAPGSEGKGSRLSRRAAAGSTSPAAATGRALSREIWIDTDIVIDNVIEDRVLLTQPLTLATSSLGRHHRQFFIERAEVYRCFPYSVCGTTKTIFFAVGGAMCIFFRFLGCHPMFPVLCLRNHQQNTLSL